MRSISIPICLLYVSLLFTTSAAVLQPRQASGLVAVEGFYEPSSNGGSLLTFVYGTYPEGLTEPINIIVSNNSDPRVLGEAREAWMASIGYSSNCLGVIAENQHRADLGDGNGPTNETDIKRWNYKDYESGACLQTLRGGNHFRYWVQNGTEAPSGALFLSASVERNLTYNHAIERPNGYDAGRDEIVGNATRSEGTSALGYSFTATASIVSDLLQAGSQGINHDIAIDGDVAVLTVQIVESGLPISSATSNIVSALPISESAALQAVQSSAVAGGLPSAAGSGSLKIHAPYFLSALGATVLAVGFGAITGLGSVLSAPW